jgi:aspartate aminotransferase
MMGWRVGYAAGPRELVAEMTKLQSQTTSCASSIGQAAALAALSGPQDLLRERAAALAERRDLMVDLLHRAGLPCVTPAGTFYLFPSSAGAIGKTIPDGRAIESGRDFATYLLDTAGVAVVPGEDCGASPYFRASFAMSPEVLREGMARIQRAYAALS